MSKRKYVVLLLLLGTSFWMQAQSKQETAQTKALQAIKLVDSGKIDEGIALLKEAQKLDPETMDYPYELAYAYSAQKEYKKAVKILEKLLEHKDVNARVYQMLGNNYDYLGKPDEAIETYKKGLQKFPEDGGVLYTEMGLMQINRKEYGKALGLFELGIEKDPVHPSNYYWASKIYSASTEEIWGMLYGEIYMNLDRNSARTEEISKLLHTVYQREIKYTSDSTMTVSFSQSNTITISDASDPSNFKMPFGMIYESNLMMGLVNTKRMDIHNMVKLRSHFLKTYFSGDQPQKYPNALFDYQKKIEESGHFEAYSYWLLMKGDEEGADIWIEQNKEKWSNFVTWFNENPMEVNHKVHFYRGQY